MIFRTVYLHVGPHKTGTSAVQLFAHENRGKLIADGLLYPECGQWNDHAHHHFGFALWNSDASARRRTLAALLDELRQEAEEAACRDALISSELFERLPFDPDRRAALIEFLASLGRTVRPIIMLRRQDLLLESVFKQWVKDPAVRLAEPFGRWLAAQRARCDFAALIEGWAAIAAAPIVQNNPFDEHPAVRFAKLLPRIQMERYEVPQGVVNPTLDGLGLELKFFANRLLLEPEFDRRLLQAILKAKLSRPKLAMFTPEARSQFLASVAQTNAEVVERFGLNAFETGEPDAAREFREVNGMRLLEALTALREVDGRVAGRLTEELRKRALAP